MSCHSHTLYTSVAGIREDSVPLSLLGDDVEAFGDTTEVEADSNGTDGSILLEVTAALSTGNNPVARNPLFNC